LCRRRPADETCRSAKTGRVCEQFRHFGEPAGAWRCQSFGTARRTDDFDECPAAPPRRGGLFFRLR
jgi:hypothetical protein